MKKIIYLVAGGTGGHINAALSLGEYLQSNYKVKYISGTRYLDYKLFEKSDVLHLDSKPLRTKNPFTLVKNLCKNFAIFLKLMSIYIKEKPRFIVGAGGYICGPTLLAGWFLRVPVFIIEQNAIAGVTNKILSKFSKKIFTNFKETKGLPKYKTIVSGNPIRSQIKYTPIKENSESVSVLVFGGSLGAKQINEVIKELVSKTYEKNIKILHQVGKDLIDDEVIAKIEYIQVEYIEDMQKAYEECDLIIARAGASTISELRVVQKPVLLIPFPFATDNHQYFNAVNLKEESKFYVNVIDYNLPKEKIVEIVYKEIQNFQAKSLEVKTAPIGANSIIKKEIEKCLE